MAGAQWYDGLVVVDKPAGFTSHDVVAKLRKAYGQRRVGHAGTLDPDATGVLLVGLGRVTRLLRFLQETGKAYRGTVVFGVATEHARRGRATSLDRAADADRRASRSSRPCRAFVGDIEQVPPMVSAVKVGGRRLHELARAGRGGRACRSAGSTSTRSRSRSSSRARTRVATIVVECSSGTYIRTLAADLGAALGGCAHLGSLRRLPRRLVHARRGAPARRDRGRSAARPCSPRRRRCVTSSRSSSTTRARARCATARRSRRGAAADRPGDGPFAVVDPDGDAARGVRATRRRREARRRRRSQRDGSAS